MSSDESNDDTEHSVGRISLDRRTVLQGTLAATGAGLLGSGAVGGDSGDPEATPAFVDPPTFDDHIDDAIDRRESIVEELIEDPADDGPINDGNDDESYTYDDESGSPYAVPFGYQKALGYETDIGNSPGTYQDFLDAVEDGPDGDYPLGDDRPLISPPSGQSHATEGTDPWLGGMPEAYSVFDDEHHAEMLEAYVATHFRDVSFADYDDPGEWDPFQDDLADEYDEDLTDIGRISIVVEWLEPAPGDALAFRDAFVGCEEGPYVSQHLMHEVSIGEFDVDLRVEPIEQSFGTTFADHQEIVRGEIDGAEPGHDDPPEIDENDLGDPRYIANGRDLATYVRTDPAYQPYLLAALQLFEWEVPFADVPFGDDDQVLPYIDAGAVAILDLLARVTRNAMLAAWHQKWMIHRRIRPDTFAGRVYAHENRGFSDLVPDFSDRNTVELLVDDPDTNTLLPLTFPEGSPAHPAYPSGHSVIAGACATVLKAFFEDLPYDAENQEPVGVPILHSEDGEEPDDWTGDTDDITVHGEINKLASNIGMGRIFAGVHYRTDHVYGMLLGEQIATATLYDHFKSDSSTSTDALDPEDPLTFSPLIDELGGEVDATPYYFLELRDRSLDRDDIRP